MRPFRAELELCAPMGDILKAAATAVTNRVAVSASQPVRVVEIRASRPAPNHILVGGTYEQNRLIIRRPGGPRGGHGKRPGGAFSDSAGAVRPRQRCLGLRSGGICFHGSEPELTKTENAQPGIYLVSWIAFQL